MKVVFQQKSGVSCLYNVVQRDITTKVVYGGRVMEIMSIKQFADSQGITYEAVRKQVVRYAEELSDHVIRKGRTQYLDETAIEFLKERRRESPIVLQTIDQSEEISRLQAQLESLRSQLVSAQNKLLETQERVISLQDEAQKALEDKARYTALLEDNEAKEKKLQETEDQLRRVEAERDEAVQESKSYYKSWFGFYRKY
jgi:tRNA U34 5-carboxymethylaminomethyl modifying GTPase MnmE/TrmE